jgi:hypothetical protein
MDSLFASKVSSARVSEAVAHLYPLGGVHLMQCLTPVECSEWLRQRDIIEAPYSHDKPAAARCFQFEPPMKPSRLTAFTRALFDAFGDFPGALLVFTDWSTHNPDEMSLMASLRRGHGEQRWLIDAPGHLFIPTEQADAIGHSYLAVAFGWSVYLYLSSGAATVFFWEGDLIDFWSSDESLSQRVLGVVTSYELRVTSKRAA